VKAALARSAYSLLLRLATPVYLARLWWRGAREPVYRQHLAQRLGFDGTADGTGRLWLHAVSLGETRAAAPLIEQLRAQRPGLRLLLTHGTATGREAGRALLQPGDAQAWLPYDTPGAVRRFLRQHRPVLGVLMETEVWPNLLHEARAAGVPLVLANARLSERSEAKGRRLAALMHPAMACFTQVLAQTETDSARLRASGAQQVQVLGNLKFDMTPKPELLARGQAWGRAAGRPVVLAAVTREGEEAPLLQAWRAQPVPRPLLWVVPRHPQRFDEVAALVLQAGFTLSRRSAWVSNTPSSADVEAEVWLGDTLGEMPAFYAAAGVALLGGSFAPLGGQNLIEAAACGCPVVMGPHTFNFAQAAELALAAGAALRVATIDEGVAQAVAISRGLDGAQGAEGDDGAEGSSWSSRALAFAATHRGAAQRMAKQVLTGLR
jgi:3-deoxy-D-manno-octulosonic-acid transferase